MLALLQTIYNHLYSGGFFYSINLLRQAATEEDLNLPVSVASVNIRGEVVIVNTLRDALFATDMGLLAERTCMLCALHQLPEEVLSRLASRLNPDRNTTEQEYKQHVSDVIAKMAHERHVMTISEFLAFSHKSQLGKYLVNKLLSSGLLLQDQVHLLVEEAVLDPNKYWVISVGRILLAYAVDGVNSEFRCRVQTEEDADPSGWPPVGWPVR